MSKNGSVFEGNITSIREVEDKIRATRRYTEGIGTMRAVHPVQGENFASKVFCKYYEVCPDIEVSWDMPAGVALDWLWGETQFIDVMFKYDYRCNKASVMVRDGIEAVKKLANSIDGFSESLAKVIAGANGQKEHH